MTQKGHRTVGYPLHEQWLNVDCPDDLDRANDEFSEETEYLN